MLVSDATAPAAEVNEDFAYVEAPAPTETWGELKPIYVASFAALEAANDKGARLVAIPDALDREINDAFEAHRATYERMRDHPVSTVAEALEKAAFLEKDRYDNDDLGQILLADLRRVSRAVNSTPRARFDAAHRATQAAVAAWHAASAALDATVGDKGEGDPEYDAYAAARDAACDAAEAFAAMTPPDVSGLAAQMRVILEVYHCTLKADTPDNPATIAKWKKEGWIDTGGIAWFFDHAQKLSASALPPSKAPAAADEQFIAWEAEMDRLRAKLATVPDAEYAPFDDERMKLDRLIRVTPCVGPVGAAAKLRRLLDDEIGLIAAGDAATDEDCLRTALEGISRGQDLAQDAALIAAVDAIRAIEDQINTMAPYDMMRHEALSEAKGPHLDVAIATRATTLEGLKARAWLVEDQAAPGPDFEEYEDLNWKIVWSMINDLKGLAGLPTSPLADAELIAIGWKLDELIPACNAAYAEAREAHKQVGFKTAATRIDGETEEEQTARITALEDASGFTAATDRGDALTTQIEQLAQEAEKLVPTTVAGFVVKARLAADEAGPFRNDEDGRRRANNLINDLLALHGGAA